MDHSPPSASASTAYAHTNGTSADEIGRVFDAQRAFTTIARRSDAEQRIAKIERIRKAVLDRRGEIRSALHADLKKAPTETDLSEIKAVRDEAAFVQKNLKSWMQPQSVPTPAPLFGTQSKVQYTPKGVVLIISPWNYPFNLTLRPLISALAAGNCVILKPSEYTPNSARLMRSMIDELFDEREVELFEGDKEVAQTLLDQPFDHIFFTGSPRVGKIVMRKAADHLASVTLELGGKSPAIVDETADVEAAAQRIAWGKFMNAGQTCIAPDYVLVHERVHDELVDHLRRNIRKFYGTTDTEQRMSTDYARLVNDDHFQEVQSLYTRAIEDGAHLAAGGHSDPEDRYMSPTLLTDVPLQTPAMEEEIFGPLLPIVSFRLLDEALDVVHNKPNPLALYLFTNSKATEETVLERTQTGGVCVNDVLIHFMNPNLPFGGAGHSGIGRSNGFFGFREFSHERAVLRRTTGSALMRQLFPPYDGLKKRLADWLVKYF